MSASHKMAEEVYKQANANKGQGTTGAGAADGGEQGPASDTGTTGGDGKEKVVDAEIVDEDEKKKGGE